jgi:hypothetical protein
VPDPPEVTVIQETELAAVQAQPVTDVTAIEPVPALEAAGAVVGATV